MTPEGAAALLTAATAAVGAAWTVLRSARKDAALRQHRSSDIVLSGYDKLVGELQEEIARLRSDLDIERQARELLQSEVDTLRRTFGGR